MDALEFLREAKRCYESDPHKYSEDISLKCGCFEILISEVEQWSKEHQTRQTKFLKQHPNAAKNDKEDFIDIGPCYIDTTYPCRFSPSNPHRCYECKKEYWSEEVK